MFDAASKLAGRAATAVSSAWSGAANDPRGNLAGCQKVNSLFAGNKQPSGFMDKAKAAFGSSVSQGAFNYVNGQISKVAIDNNVNSGVRQLFDAVKSGATSFAGSTTNQASRAVMGAAGINPGVVPPDPQGQSIFNNAEFAANTLGNALISGVIEEANLPGPISSLSALAFLQQNESRTIDISDPGCGITPYARDLIQYAPKHNFMFMVKFVFQPPYNDVGMQEHKKIDEADKIKFHYLCRSFTRPSINVDYEEVNMYNFRTKVAKRVDYEPVQLRLHDDNQNSSMVFLEKYLKSLSPVARRSPNEGDLYELKGMNFEPDSRDRGGIKVNMSSASVNGLDGTMRSILKEVEVYHIFDYGKRVNKYTFINPKISVFKLSDFDMDGDAVDPASIDLTLVYDSMFIETDIEVPTPHLQERSALGERHVRKYAENK